MKQRKKIVAGNWKMNTDYNSALSLMEDVKRLAAKNSDVLKIIFPPFPFIKSLADIINNENNFFVGAQNCSRHDKGAYTGEVSADILRSVGCDYVIIGHSERRAYFKETNEELRAKIQQALANSLNVIFCVGEHLQERKNETHFNTVETQLKEVLQHFQKENIQQLVVAYEPVWAIGTGETASPQQTQEMHAYIRTVLGDLFSKEIAQELSILYGGSCNAQNAKELFACADVDGGLIGGASLKAEDFCKIINSFA